MFDDNPAPGAHLAEASRRSIESGYGRWLSFLLQCDRNALGQHPADRITLERVRAYVAHLDGALSATSVAATIHFLRQAARLIAPDRDWSTLRSLQRRLEAQARPVNRLERLSAPWAILDLGLTMMVEAEAAEPDPWHRREVAFRNGLIVALISLWPIRRRSIATLSVSRHVEMKGDRITLLLFPEDTKAGRAEAFDVPELLLPWLRLYLRTIRPALLRGLDDDALWVSQKLVPLGSNAVYNTFRRLTGEAFGSPMCLHDVRRSAATFTAVENPHMIGIIPGVLQHATAEVSERHYNLAQSARASRRHVSVVGELRAQAVKRRDVRRE